MPKSIEGNGGHSSDERGHDKSVNHGAAGLGPLLEATVEDRNNTGSPFRR
jgi:hypothetical protein